MRTVKILKIVIPLGVTSVEFSLEDFKTLAKKQEWNPIFETCDSLIHLDFEVAPIIYVAKKENRQK